MVTKKRAVRVHKYSRKPYQVRGTKVKPKATRSHLRLIESIMKLNKDITKSLSKEHAKYKKDQQRLARERKRNLAALKNAKTAEEINHLRREQAVLEEKNRLATIKMAGLQQIDEFRRSRIPFAPGTPVSRYVGKLKTREEIERTKDNMIRSRALALQQLANLRSLKTTDEYNKQVIRNSAQAAEMERQAQAREAMGKSAIPGTRAVSSVTERLTSVPMSAVSNVAKGIEAHAQHKEEEKHKEEKQKFKEKLESEGLPKHMTPEQYTEYLLGEKKAAARSNTSIKEERVKAGITAAQKTKEFKRRLAAEKEERAAQRKAAELKRKAELEEAKLRQQTELQIAKMKKESALEEARLLAKAKENYSDVLRRQIEAKQYGKELESKIEERLPIPSTPPKEPSNLKKLRAYSEAAKTTKQLKERGIPVPPELKQMLYGDEAQSLIESKKKKTKKEVNKK